jgi:hypothetical protein
MFFNEIKTAFYPHTINDLMTYYNLTIKDISDTFQIPYRTVQNWAGGVTNPPPYIIRMIWVILVNEELIEDYKKEVNHYYDGLGRASDLLHDQRFTEAISLIDNL